MSNPARIRREPPPFRPVTVLRTEPVTGWLRRITLGGPELTGMPEAEPAASVRLLLPEEAGLTMPDWNGNEFLRADGSRPVIRTFTPRGRRPEEIDIEVVLHEGGAASTWVKDARPGDEAALSGPGRGSAPGPGAAESLLVGDETAVPAIAQLLETMPAADWIGVLIETTHPDDPAPLPDRADATVTWLPRRPGDRPGTALVAAVEQTDLPAGLRVWAAGEAAAMQQIRRLLGERGIPRQHTTVRGYWKQGRTASAS